MPLDLEPNITERIDGVWVRQSDPEPDWPQHNILNAAFVIDALGPTPAVFDRYMGGPFRLTRIQRLDTQTYLLRYYFHRGGFEVVYSLQFGSELDAMLIRHESGLNTREVTIRTSYRVPESRGADHVGVLRATDPETGIVNARNLRLRSEPNPDATILTVLDEGAVLDFIERSDAPQMIGTDWAFWYLVTDADGTTGWVFGAFVDLSG